MVTQDISQMARAVVSLREMILQGELVPGQRIAEARVADRLSMSRTPIRQALPLLAREGLVEIAAGRGYVVRAVRPEDVGDALDVRGVVEGLAARRNPLIIDGVLQGFVHNSYSARRMGTRSTGNAVRGGFKSTPGVGCMALQLQPGTRDQAAMIADISDGVLVQSVQGLHSGVNPISGDFSVGASGLTISGGAVGAPIREFTIASTVQRMLLDVVEVGGDVDWLPGSAAGVSLVIRDITLSGA